MILIDANLLAYAFDRRSPWYEQARMWLTGLLEGAAPVGLASSTIVTFVRLATDPRIYAEPLTIDDAIAAIDALATIDTVSLVIPGPRHYSILREVLLASRATRNLVPDAALAALAIEHGATIATNDRDFDRFRAARVIYPLEAR